jgi:hypothetical protein
MRFWKSTPPRAMPRCLAEAANEGRYGGGDGERYGGEEEADVGAGDEEEGPG